jgi:hypothetical protein
MDQLVTYGGKIITIYKTSVTKKTEVRALKAQLDPLGKWNFDLDDCDKILRIESEANIETKAIDLLAEYGFICVEL